MVLAMASLACACARERSSYVAIDPQTGQQVGGFLSPSPRDEASQAMAQSPPQAQLQAANDTSFFGGRMPSGSRGLFGGSSQPSPQAQAYYPPQVIQVPPSSAAGGRGAYAQAPAYQSGYSAPPAYVPQQQPAYAARAQAPAQPRPAYQAYASAPAAYQETYALDTGDKLRIIVFGQDGLSSSYTVDAGGNVTMPLIGSVPARGMSTANLADSIASRLKQGYVREPKVTVEVEAYRPFFILGEVTTPGQYAYTPNMTAETAIAIAGGFAPRASKSTVKVTRNLPGQQFSGDVPLNFELKPGDTVLVKERWF
jgi:polysaccharide export outer membrane protein